MSNKLDVDDLINWLNQSEDEAKATVAESGASATRFTMEYYLQSSRSESTSRRCAR